MECAFLHGELKEEVYMSQPQGYVDNTKPTHVCQMIKSIYGLRQAPRAWYEKFTTKLIELGFVVSTSDSSLFILANDSVKLYLLLYVDDIIITGTSSVVIDQLIQILILSFKMKDMGALSYFLGISITRSRSDLMLSQSKYILQLLDKSDMLGCKPVSSPATVTKLNKTDGELLSDLTSYRSIVGALLYVTLTRPDIAYSVN